MAGRRYKLMRTARPFDNFLADALIDGCELLRGTSGLDPNNTGELDPELARAAWEKYRERVLAYAGNRKVWARKFD